MADNPKDLPPLEPSVPGPGEFESGSRSGTAPGRPVSLNDDTRLVQKSAAGDISTAPGTEPDARRPSLPPPEAPVLLDVRGVPPTIGRYRVLGRIATGGMADILLGKLMGPSGFERAVVIKSILPHLARDDEFVGMFLDEARLTSQIRHPNVVQVNELGRDGNLLFLVMEYLDGESCNTILREAARRSTHPPHLLGAHICAEVASGLHAAHTLKDDSGVSRAVVHRDVSPQNIFVSYDGHVKLLDFGIAKATGRQAEATRTGQIKGKFAYMAPEQAMLGELDARTDVFSLGVVLWEMTTGRRLFKRASELMVLRALNEDPIPLPSAQIKRYPPLLESIVMKALARDPAKRFQTALDFRQALASWLRTYDADDTVEHELALYMNDRFTDRATSKRALLKRVAESAAFDEIEISVVSEPSMDITTGDTSFELPILPRSSRKRAWLFPLIAACCALALALALGGVIVASRAKSATANSSAPVVPALVAVPEVVPPTVQQEVRVHIESQPSSCAVTIDGISRGTTPTDVVVARDKPIAIELTRNGYLTLRDQRTPHNDIELHLVLQRAPSTQRPHGRTTGRPASGDQDPFHRFE